MANVHIPDDVLLNILSRLPGKPLLRFRCVSTHWNGLISDPCFMNSRSRRMILLQNPWPLAVIDDNVPAEDMTHSIVKIPSPLKNHHQVKKVTIVGTFNGLVVLVITDMSYCSHMYLYNPLTCVSKILLVLDRPFPCNEGPWVFALSLDDLKIFIFGTCFINRMGYICDVFDLKTSSWTSLQCLESDFIFWCDVGMFLNGSLYWLTTSILSGFRILALNVKEMVFSKIKVPFHINEYHGILLGSLNECLCLVNKNDDSTNRFDVWLMREQVVENNSWLKICSFTFGLEGDCFKTFHAMHILGDGKILLTNGSNQLAIFDTSNDSYLMLNNLASHDDFKKIEILPDFSKIRPVEYVESLVSPSNVCFS